MFEARLIHGNLMKKIWESTKDLVKEASWQCQDEGISLQTMDPSHVALVAVELGVEAFNRYRCDRPLEIGMNFDSLGKILRKGQKRNSIEKPPIEITACLFILFNAQTLGI